MTDKQPAGFTDFVKLLLDEPETCQAGQAASKDSASTGVEAANQLPQEPLFALSCADGSDLVSLDAGSHAAQLDSENGQNDIQRKPDCSEFVTITNLDNQKLLAVVPSPALSKLTGEESLQLAGQKSLLDAKALPLSWLLEPKTEDFWDHVLAHRLNAEAHERNPHFKSDHRQTFIALSLLAKILRPAPGQIEMFAEVDTDPFPACFVQSSYTVHNCHPDQVWPRLLMTRREQLGIEFSRFYDEKDLWKGGDAEYSPAVPKKGQVSVIDDIPKTEAL